VDKKTNQAIGVFDSGIGGLTVVRALMERLPFENIIYFGDTARVPYGTKSVENINRYACQITEFLLKKDVKLLVVACNTMAAVAYQAIKDLSPVPVMEVIEASARNAAAETTTKSIGVIGTPACPLFVPLVEEGWFDHPATRLIAQEYLKPVLAEQIDALVLGCTHYPLLKSLLQEIVGPKVNLIDSAEAMADATVDLLNQLNLGNPNRHPPKYLFCVSDVPYRFQTIGERFLGRSLGQVELVRL
jgi:glutamate racemase